MESILTSIKKLLGIPEDDESFDTDIIIHINSVFMILNQLGVGPTKGFKIYNKEDIWDDYITDEIAGSNITIDTNACNAILSFLIRTWPVRYPERIIIYLDISTVYKFNYF